MAPVLLHRRGRALIATLNRPEAHNALDGATLDGLEGALDGAEADTGLRALVIAGQPGVFCTGTDFTAAGAAPADAGALAAAAGRVYRLLARFAKSRSVIVCAIDGRTQAGGMGLAAACDYVLCSPRSGFGLPEVRLGLVPAVVLPFLVQRIGWQRAYALTLTARTLDAAEARTQGLVDEIDADGERLRHLLLGLDRTPAQALEAAKRYAQALRPPLAASEGQAVARITSLLADPATLATIRELQHHGLWQQGGGA